jgi:hypothetical protein
MVTSAEGLRAFQTGMGQLGEGMTKYGEGKRLAKGAESIRGEDPSQFTTGEAGQEQAAIAFRGGDIRAAESLRAPKSIEGRMQNLAIKIAEAKQAGDTEAVTKLSEAFNNLGPFMKSINKYKEVARSRGGGGGRGKGGDVDYGDPKMGDVMPYDLLYTGVEDRPKREDYSEWFSGEEYEDQQYNAAVKDWEKRSQETMRTNAANYNKKLGGKFHPNTIDDIVAPETSRTLNTSQADDIGGFIESRSEAKYKNNVKGLLYPKEYVKSHNEQARQNSKKIKKEVKKIGGGEVGLGASVSSAPKGSVTVEKGGKQYTLPEKQLEQAKKEGYKLVK